MIVDKKIIEEVVQTQEILKESKIEEANKDMKENIGNNLLNLIGAPVEQVEQKRKI